jgi:hypothetical protein
MDKSRDSNSKVFPNKATSLQSLALLDSNSILVTLVPSSAVRPAMVREFSGSWGLSMCSTNQQLGAGEVEAASKGRDR